MTNTTAQRVNIMNILVNGDAGCVASMVVKSKTSFPDLFPFDAQVAVVFDRRSMKIFATFDAVCKRFLASLPLADLGVIIAISLLASA